MKRWKVFHCFRSFFKGEEGVNAAQPMDVHDVQPQNESQMVDEHDRSTKLDDLNLEDWPLEDSFKIVSDFLDLMPSNTQDTEPERSIRTASPSSVSSLDRSRQNQQLEALEQQMLFYGFFFIFVISIVIFLEVCQLSFDSVVFLRNNLFNGAH